MSDYGNGNGNGIGNGNGRIATSLNGSSRPESRRLTGSQAVSNNLADLLERVLDKGIIIAGDITLCLGEIELLQIKIRLLIASVDKARDMGIDWWQHDPALSSAAQKAAEGRDELTQRLERLEAMIGSLVRDREPVVPPAVVAGVDDRIAVHPPATDAAHP
jgi:hypothetical protein